MALDKQVSMYSVDTSAFYTKKEKRIHIKNMTVKVEKKQVRERITVIEKELLNKYGLIPKQLKDVKRLSKFDEESLSEITQLKDRRVELLRIISFKNKCINQNKTKISSLL